MTTARNDRRPDRRPEWLRRKHGHAWPKPRTELDLWADKVVQILNDYQTGQRTTPWPDQASADAARKALNRAARRAGVSVGAYLADPDIGMCANCDRMQCQPSAKRQLVLHVNTFTKKESYAYMLERYGPDTCKWPRNSERTRARTATRQDPPGRQLTTKCGVRQLAEHAPRLMPRADRLATARAARDGARAPGHWRLGCLREGELPLAAPAADLHCRVRLPVRDPCPRHLTRLRKRNGPVDRAVARRSRLAWQPPDAHHLAGEPLPDPARPTCSLAWSEVPRYDDRML